VGFDTFQQNIQNRHLLASMFCQVGNFISDESLTRQ